MVSAETQSAPAVAPAKAARPAVVRPEPAKPLELSPGVAELSPAERRAAFMAAPVEAKEGEPKEEPNKEPEQPAAEQPAESEPEAKAAEGDETPEPEAKAEDPEEELVSGLAKLAEKDPALKGILKRTQKALKQNSERAKEVETLKADLEAAKAKPPVLLAPTQDNPLSHLHTEEQVDAEVRAIVGDARNRIRWLERHLDEGGVWNEGTPNAQEMSPEQVAAALNHYEDIRDGIAADMGKARKAEMAEYAATLKTLNVPAEDLVKPAVPTRESKFFARVPEMQRDPTFLQFLADAKAGREAREDKARGVKTVKVEPGKVKPKAETGKVPSKGEEGDGNPQRGEEQATSTDLAALRAQAAAGSQEARAALRRAFVTQV